MKNKLIELVESKGMKSNLTKVVIGQNVKVHVLIKEGNKQRIQIFEGLIIAIKNSGVNKTIKVRKISYGVGVERTFLINSPLIEKIEIVRTNKIRRSKLYYMREKSGKSARLKQVFTNKIK